MREDYWLNPVAEEASLKPPKEFAQWLEEHYAFGPTLIMLAVIYNNTLFTRAHQSAQQLIAVKHFTGLILFHDQNRHAFNDFICCKAFVALQALAAAADSFPFVRSEEHTSELQSR